MVKNLERQTFVRSLASFARTCGTEVVREDAGRAKVTEMMESIRASSGPSDVKASAETTWQSYEATYTIAAQLNIMHSSSNLF